MRRFVVSLSLATKESSVSFSRMVRVPNSIFNMRRD